MKKFIIILFFIPVCILSAPESRLMYNQGIEAFKSGSYSSAELLFRKTLENNDDYSDKAWFYLSRSIYQQQKYKSAIFEFNSFLTKCRTESLRVESRFWMGESYFKLNEYLKAIEEYRRFLEKSKDKTLSVTAHDRIASIYFKQQRYEESVIEWSKAIKINDNKEQNATLILKIGQSLFDNGEYEEALERLNPLTTSLIDSKSKARIRLMMGRIYQHQKNHNKALITLNGISKELSGEAPFYDVYFYRSVSYIELGKISKAKSELEVFSSIANQSTLYYDGLYLLGKILIESGKDETGIEFLHKVWEKTDKQDLALSSSLILAKEYIEKDPQKSIDYVEKFLSTEDENSKKKILIILSKAYIQIDEYSKVEELLKIYVKDFPFDQQMDEVNFLRARVYLEKGEIEKATEMFNTIKRDNPFSQFIEESEYYLALVNYKKNKYNESIIHLKKYLQKKNTKNRYEAHTLLSELYLKKSDLTNAERQIKILISRYINYKNVEKYIYNVAVELYKLKSSRGQKYLQLILKNFPSSESAMLTYMLYGNNSYQQKRYKSAITYYKKFLSSTVVAHRGSVFYNLLKSYYNLEEYDEVINILKTVKVPPLNENQWRELPLIHARSHYKKKNYEDVYNLLKWEDVQSFSNSDALIFVQSTLEIGDLTSATQIINSLKSRTNFFGETMLMLAEFYSKSGETAEAERVYHSMIKENISALDKGRALIELSLINKKSGDYKGSLAILKQIKIEQLQAERDSLIIINTFLINQGKQASKMTNQNLKSLLNNPFTEELIKLNMQYYFDQLEIKYFNKYASLLIKYEGNRDLIYYLYAKIYFKTGSYKKAFYNFYKLSLLNTPYATETSYYLGRISMTYYRNRKNAIKYYTVALKNSNGTNEFVLKSKLDLAIIYHEIKDYSQSKHFLNEILEESGRARYRIKAKNLIEYYKY